MTEAEAKEWLTTCLGVSRETMGSLDAFVEFLKLESASQNLIAASTIEDIWSRHIVDSAQLLTFMDKTRPDIKWLDLGSGAGFPGLIIALLTDFEVTLVESRARRIEYLERAIDMLDIGHRVSVMGMPLERMKTAPFSVISARAFAPLPKLFELAARFSTNNTLWLLPKGRNAVTEWGDAEAVWDGAFSVKQSITDADAGILVGTLAGKRKGGGTAGAKGQKA
jgi:16S rRNA (guanine527-N7)-methyltransferase